MRKTAALLGLLTLVAGSGPVAAMTCVGASTMQDLAGAWAEAFNRGRAGERIEIDRSTRLSAEGFAALLAVRADCVTYVREPFESELSAYRARFGGAPLVLAVAGGSYATPSGTHAIAIYVNAANPIAGLDLTQLAALFRAERPLTRWGELGLGGDWAERPIHVYGMLRRRATGNPPGIVNYMRDRILAGGELRDDLREQADRPGEPALAGIVHRIAGDPDGIGFSGFAFAVPATRTVPLAATAQGPYYTGTRGEVASRAYPLSRSLYLMLRPRDGGRLSPLQRDFLRSVLSEPGQSAVAASAMRFLPLTAAQLAEQRARLDRFPDTQ